MINDSDILYWIWFSQVFGTGCVEMEFILSKVDSPKMLYELGKKSGFNKIKFLSGYTVNKMENTKMDEAKKILERCQEKGYEIVTISDEIYPNRLKNIYASPAVLYINGNIGGIDDILAITIVGTRKCSEYAKRVTQIFAKELALSGVAIVSGLAVGIDSIALKETVDNGGNVIAVLGCGLDVNYPIKNMELKRRIEETQGNCIISEYPPGTRPFAYNFPIRNRIMSGLSVGVLVIEAGVRSGSLITAKLAIDQGKDVYGIPNNIFYKNNMGTMNLLKDGAMIVTEPEDIVGRYRWQYSLKNSVIRSDIIKKEIEKDGEDYINMAKNFDVDDIKSEEKIKRVINSKKSIDKKEKREYNLDGLSKEIYELLEKEGPMSVNDISQKMAILVNEILVSITELELLGAIKNHQGIKYEIN